MDHFSGKSFPVAIAVLFLSVFAFRISCALLDSSRAVETSRQEYEKASSNFDPPAIAAPTEHSQIAPLDVVRLVPDPLYSNPESAEIELSPPEISINNNPLLPVSEPLRFDFAHAE